MTKKPSITSGFNEKLVHPVRCNFKNLKAAVVSLFFILVFTGNIYAQTDYCFIIEKPSSKNIILFQFLVTALSSGNDTVSAIAYGESVSVLFTPLPANTPNLGVLAADKLVSEAEKTVTPKAFAEALALADSQAAAWDRSVPHKLLIITGAASSGKAPQTLSITNFESVLYLAADVEPEASLAAVASPDSLWRIDSSMQTDEDEGDDIYTLSEGLFGCLKALAPAYKKIAVEQDLAGFSVGDLIHQNRGTLILAANTTPDDIEILDDGKAMALATRSRRGAYTIVNLDDAGRGNFTLKNGEIILVAGWQRISPLLYLLALVFVVILVIGVFILLGIMVRIKGQQKKPVWKAVVENKGMAGRFTAEIAQKANGDECFGSGVTIKTLLSDMRVSETVDSSTVSDKYPQILYDRDSKKWFVEYKRTPASAGNQFQKKDEGFADIDPFKSSLPENGETAPAKKPPAGKIEINPIKGSFEVTHIFVDENIRLFLREMK
jgi:hypothetical protein